MADYLDVAAGSRAATAAMYCANGGGGKMWWFQAMSLLVAV